MRKVTLLSALCLSAVAIAVTAPVAVAGSKLVVDDDGLDCKKADYTSIQAAVSAAAPGTNIEVCPGLYQEKVTISGAAKNGLTLHSKKDLAATIKMPASMTGAVVEVSSASDVKIDGFTIAGPGACPIYGVRVVGGASVTLEKNHITMIRNNPLSGGQCGTAVLVGRQFESTTGTAKIKNNLIDDYQKTGVFVDNAGSYAQIEHNTITGVGPTPTIGQNGIQVSRDAGADVKNNTVSGNYFTGTSAASTGILTLAGGAPTIQNNEAFGNNVSLYLQDLVGQEVSHNTTHDDDYGVLLYSSQGNTVSHNNSYNSLFAMYLYLADGNMVEYNVTRDSDYGIIVDTSNDNLVAHNDASGNAFDGIYVWFEDTSDNVFLKNHLSDNAEHDAHDDSTGIGTAGTANTWEDNKCETENVSGLCKP